MWEIYEKSAFNKNREQAGFGGTSSEYSVVRKAVACFRPKREAQVPDRLEERTEEAYSTIGGRDRILMKQLFPPFFALSLSF